MLIVLDFYVMLNQGLIFNLVHDLKLVVLAQAGTQKFVYLYEYPVVDKNLQNWSNSITIFEIS